jgi:hypothetical protein
MNDLREELDRALRAVPVGAAPVERARRDGRRLRARRRAGVLAGVLAVVAVAAGYPALARSTTSAPPAPASGQSAVPAPHDTLANGDPVLSAGPGAATQGPDGLTDNSGAIAVGTTGAARWELAVITPAAENPVPADPCYIVILSTATPSSLGSDGCTDLPPQLAGQLKSGDPVAFTTLGDATTDAVIGEVADDVTYLIVTFTDGQRLKLLPVTAAGHRFTGWIAPQSMAIASVDAHLGGPYSDSGQIARTAPFDPPGQIPLFGLWQQPGQTAPPRGTGIIAAGATDGHPWEETAYEGPWGTCFATAADTTQAANTTECVPVKQFTSTQLLSGGGGDTAGPVFGSAAPGVTLVRVALSNGTTVEVNPVTIGNENLFAFWLGQGISPAGWTAYNAAGKKVGAGNASAHLAPATTS